MNTKNELADNNFIPDETRYAESLSEFIKYKTISEKRFYNKKEFDKLREYVFNRYPLITEYSEYIDFDGGIYMRFKGRTDNKPLVLMSHYDVVAENGKWSKDAWCGEIDKNVIWGRGAVDTKGSLVAIFEAVESLLAEQFVFDRDIIIISSSNEEIAGNNVPETVAYMKNKYIVPYLVVDEGGGIIESPVPGVSGKFAMIGMVERNSARLLLETKNSKKTDAIIQMSDFIKKVSAMKIGKRDLGEINEAMFNSMLPNMNYILKFIFKHLRLFKPLILSVLPKVNPAAAQLIGATVKIITPSDDETIDMDSKSFRMIARISGNYLNKIDDLIAEFTAYANKFGVTVKVLSSRETPPPVSVQSDGYKIISKVVGNVFDGVTVCPYCILGGTDARHFIGFSQYVIRFAPIYMNAKQFSSFHNVDENLNIDSLAGAVKFYRELIKFIK